MTGERIGLIAAAVLCSLAWSAHAKQVPAGDPKQSSPTSEGNQASDAKPAPPITEQPVDKFTPFSGGQEVSKDFPVSFPTDI